MEKAEDQQYETPVDPREFRLSAGDLHAVADRLYDSGDERLEPMGDVSARFGIIRSRLRGLADALEEDEATARHRKNAEFARLLSEAIDIRRTGA